MADPKQTPAVQNNSVADKFRGLPIEDLIAAPLKAVSDSQRQLALSTYDYIMQIGFNQEEGNFTTPRVVKFELERPAKNGGMSKIGIQAPFLSMVPIPSVMVTDVNIDFQMEVTDSVSSKSKLDTSVETEVTGRYGFLFARGTMKMNGKVSSARENTRSTNQTAKYQVHVTARQQPPTEGLSRLLDILSSCVEEITALEEENNK